MCCDEVVNCADDCGFAVISSASLVESSLTDNAIDDRLEGFTRRWKRGESAAACYQSGSPVAHRSVVLAWRRSATIPVCDTAKGRRVADQRAAGEDRCPPDTSSLIRRRRWTVAVKSVTDERTTDRVSYSCCESVRHTE